jgi:hypothetical protein
MTIKDFEIYFYLGKKAIFSGEGEYAKIFQKLLLTLVGQSVEIGYNTRYSEKQTTILVFSPPYKCTQFSTESSNKRRKISKMYILKQ